MLTRYFYFAKSITIDWFDKINWWLTHIIYGNNVHTSHTVSSRFWYCKNTQLFCFINNQDLPKVTRNSVKMSVQNAINQKWTDPDVPTYCVFIQVAWMYTGFNHYWVASISQKSPEPSYLHIIKFIRLRYHTEYILM